MEIPAETVLAGLARLGANPALVSGTRTWSGTDAGGDAWPQELTARDVTVPDDLFGEDVRRVVVLAPLNGLGGDAALAAWAAGACVVLPGDGNGPAWALAQLERAEADVAVLPGRLLRTLPGHPAAALADLPTLRRIVYDGPALTAEDADAVRTVLGTEPVRAEPATDLVQATERAADAESGDIGRAVAALDRLSRTALLAMLNGLDRCGAFTTGDVVGVAAPEHRPLLARWVDVLEAEGLLRRDGDRLHPVPGPDEYGDDTLTRAWADLEREWQATAGSAGTIAYARNAARRLPDLIQGREKAVHVLFPEGRTDLAEALYRESVTARYQHRAVAALVSGIAARHDGPGPLRVLEVGAGTGSTSERVIPALDGHDVDYLYTDVSPLFLTDARRRWGHLPWVRYGRYDIDVPPGEQGHTDGSFDVVVAGGVLNAARDTDASVRGLARVLVPGGWLVLTEPTVEEYWVMASQAFMLPEAADGRADTGATFLTLPQWNRVLDGAGLRRVVGLPGPGHPLERLGHRVFAARTASDHR